MSRFCPIDFKWGKGARSLQEIIICPALSTGWLTFHSSLILGGTLANQRHLFGHRCRIGLLTLASNPIQHHVALPSFFLPCDGTWQIWRLRLVRMLKSYWMATGCECPLQEPRNFFRTSGNLDTRDIKGWFLSYSKRLFYGCPSIEVVLEQRFAITDCFHVHSTKVYPRGETR